MEKLLLSPAEAAAHLSIGRSKVYELDGDRWRGAASFGYGPDGRRIRKKVSGATMDRWLTASLPGQVSEKTLDSYADTVRPHSSHHWAERFCAS
jgi:hypothetical protein